MFEKRSQVRRRKIIPLRCTAEELLELRRMARARSTKKNPVTASDLFRFLLRREWLRWKAETPPEVKP